MLETRPMARGVVKAGLGILAVPIRIALYGHWAALVAAFALALGAYFAVRKKRRFSEAFLASFAVALSFLIVYSMFADMSEAKARNHTDQENFLTGAGNF